jgi:hypothetical protein
VTVPGYTTYKVLRQSALILAITDHSDRSAGAMQFRWLALRHMKN